ncbi:cephalosporin hydroxylase family protein [Alphaproteobacteria bacterium]|nr:cephalosporin hydroxylase family protein [Alphaproteobacteria bacterium]
MAIPKFTFCPQSSSLIFEDGTIQKLDSSEAFETISDLWLRSGWDTKYVYSFSWLGRPIIQLPDDLVRIQEVIFNTQPDVIVETGIAHGGSLVFYAGLCAAMDRGRVIGIDVEIRSHNKAAIEAHFLKPFIELVEGDSISSEIFETVKSKISKDETVLVILDSNHTKEHVKQELELYSALVKPGGLIVACDGIMKTIPGAPRSGPDWSWNNPIDAICEFLSENSNFEQVEPKWPFNEGITKKRVTYWPNAFLRRIA